MGLKTATQHNAAIDAQKIAALTAVSGTAGTADTSGTSEIVRVGANPDTGALYVQDLSGVSGTTNVSVVDGTVVTWDNLTKFAWDNLAIAYTDGTTETITYKAGAGTVGTVTVVYTDTTKGSVSTVTRSL